MRTFYAAAAALTLLALPVTVVAQTAPQKPVHLIVGFGAGGAPTSLRAFCNSRCRSGSVNR